MLLTFVGKYVKPERGRNPCVFIENNKIPWGMSHGHRFTANKYWCLFVMNWVAVHWNNVKKVNYKW